MKRDIFWTWAAEVDAQTAFTVLLDSNQTQAERFVGMIDRLMSLLQVFPLIAPTWRPPIRRALIRRSHYGLFYVVEPKRIVVIGVQDLRQDPERIRNEVVRRLP